MAVQKGLVAHYTEKRQSTTTYDFEDGTAQGWRMPEKNFYVRSENARGSYSIGVEESNPVEGVASGPYAYIEPAELRGGRKISSFEVHWYEYSGSHGGGVMLVDGEGNDVIGVATDNDELNVDDANGFSHVQNGSGYTSWYRVRLTFDWQNGEADVYWKDLDGGGVDNTHTGRPLKNTNGIARLEIRNQNAEQWQVSDFNMWFDDISYTLQDVPDRSAYDNHGDAFGGVSVIETAPLGEGLSFDGSDDYVHIGQNSIIDRPADTDSITISAFVNPDSSQSDTRGTIATRKSLYYLQVKDDRTIAVYTYNDGGGSSSYNSTSTSLPNDTWSHIVFTEASGERKIYIDGSLDSTFSQDNSIGINGDDSLRIGGEGPSDRLFKGSIGGVRIYDRALSDAEISQLYQMRSQQDAGAERVPVAQSDLVAYYPFASSGATDQSGNGHHGTVSGASYVTDGGPEATGVYNCSGSSDYVEGPVPSEVQGSATKSLTAWVKINSLANDGSADHLVNFGDDSGDQAFGWFLRDKGLRAYHFSNDSHTGYTPQAGKWVHLVLTYDGSTSRTYVDGELQDSFNSGTLNTASTRLAMGVNESLGKSSDARFSDVRIYDRALSAAEVKRIYQSERLVHGGIQKGFVSSDLSFTANQWGGSSNSGEVGVSGTQFTKRSGETVQIGPTNNGVALQESGSVSGVEGYIMYSREPVHDRFSDNPPSGGNGDHLVGVRKNGSRWQYDDNGSFHEFSPRPSDHLIAEVGWGVDYVSKLNIYA